MLAELGSDQVAEWMAFDALHPIDGLRGDWHAAQIANAIVRVHGGRSKIKDHVLRFGPKPPAPRQSPDQMLSVLRRMAELRAARPAVSRTGPTRRSP